MTQPTKYEKETDFINQTYASSLPALDKEFTNVETSINEIRENLQMFQNDDMTGLKAGVITQESVSPAFIAYLEGVASQTAGEANTNSSNAVALANTAVIDASDAKQMASDASATAEDAKNVADGAVRDIQASVLDVRNAISDIAQFKTDTNTTLSIYEGNINSAIAAIEPSIENKFGDMSGYSDTDNSGTVTVVEAITQEVEKQVIAKQELTAGSIAAALGYTPANNANLTKEITDRTNAVSSEATTRANADLELSNRIDAEEQARQSALTEVANTYLPKSGGTVTGAILRSGSGDAVACFDDASFIYIKGSRTNNSGARLMLSGKSHSQAGSWWLMATDGTNTKELRCHPVNGLTLDNATVLTTASTLDASKLSVSYLPTAGGTATGQIKSTATKGFSIERAGEAFFTTKTTTGVGHSLSFGVGASGTSRGIYDEYQKHWILYKTSTGTVNIFAKGDGESDTAHVLTIGYDGTLTHRGHSILTDVSGLPLSGGTMTGGITFSQSTSIQRAGNTTSLVINGGDSNNNASLYLHGGGRTDGMAGRFELQARLANGSFKALQGNPSGSLTWGGKNILREDTLCTTQPTTTSTASASNPAVVVENYYDSTTGDWYSVRSDGWVEQGGVSLDTASTQQSIGLNYDLGNVDYKVMITPIATTNADFRPLVANAGVGSFTVYNYSKKQFYWEVKGYKAS